MIFKNLGNSSTKIAAIGQGCGGELSVGGTRDAEGVKAVRTGIDLGMTLIDTAEAYEEGHSEELVGKAVQGIRDKVFLATKFSPENNGYEGVLRSAEGSLRRLRTDYIDLYQIHWPNPIIPIGETMRALDKLVRDGKVRHVGVSNFSVSEMGAARSAVPELEVVSNQVEYNLFDRFVERSILPFCRSVGMSIIAYSPLDKGRVANDILLEVGGRYGKTPAQVVLNWLTAQPGVIAIPKAGSLGHVRDNAAAADFALQPEDIERIGRAYCAQPALLPVDEISVSIHGEGNRKVYQTIEQALRNELNFAPSPSELAADILRGEEIKPVRVVRSKEPTHQYDLIEGRIRYWAWVIAYRGEQPIPALVRQSR